MVLFDTVPNFVRVIAFFLLFVFYDPIMVSKYGATVGHTFSKISVKREKDTNQNLSFVQAFLRFLVKLSLGWISLITVAGNEKRKAIHDFVANSVVIDDK